MSARPTPPWEQIALGGQLAASGDGSADSRVTVAGIARRLTTAPARCGAVRVACIDGPAGSGKTTLAGQLGAVTGAPVVHLDDLYQGWSQELGGPLAARLAAWLLDPWEAGLPGRHLRYDWVAGSYVNWVEVPTAPTIILEGCGCASAAVRPRAALVIWVDAPPAVRLARGLARDGSELADRWSEWQRREAEHFIADGLPEAADVRWQGAPA